MTEAAATTVHGGGPEHPPMVRPPAEGDSYELPTLDDFAEVVALVKERDDLYLRVSEGPATDHDNPSLDYESRLRLPGLSVTVLDPPDWWSRPAEDWVARRMCKYADLLEGEGDRRPWILQGRVVGCGPDHEPLVVEAVPLAWVGDEALRTAMSRYEERFDVGRDSRGD